MGQSNLDAFDGGGGAENEGEEIGVLKINYTVESGEDGPYPVVHVFGRTREGEARHVRVTGFRPYFYAPDEEVDEDVGEDERVTGTDTGYESIDGDDLTRVYTRIPADVGEVRESYTHYEADILFPNRFRIDKDVKSGLSLGKGAERDDMAFEVEADEVEPCDADSPARTCVIDIEVEDRNGFPEDGEEPVVCLTAWDSFEDEYHVFVWDIDEDEVDDDGYVLRAYGSEEEMLDAFLKYLNDRDADVLTGWNSNDFDLPYLIDRLDSDDIEGEGMEPERLSRVGEVWHDDWGGPRIKGRATFDLLYAYQRMKFTELESYRLDAIAEEELGESKVTYTGKIGDLWEDDPDKLLEYNKMDVELCVRIDDKVGIIDFFRELARFVGCSLEDATTPSDVVDIYVLRKAHGKFVLPSKRGGGGGEEYEGGEVFEPITGIRENVAVLDLACFSGDTEVVTPDGVVNVKDVSVGDEVYTLNPETFEVEVDEVTETHEYENEYGELHHVSGNTHDFRVTENHRFLVSNKRRWDSQTPDDFEFVEYRDVPETDRFAFPNHEAMEGEVRETFEFWREVDEGYAVVYADRDLRSVRHDLPDAVCDEMELAHGSSGALKLGKTGKYLVPIETYRRHRESVEDAADDVVLKRGKQHRATPTTFDTDDWLRLVGWYVTEGSVYDGGEGDHSVTLHQQGEERDEIRKLLERMNLNHSSDARGLNLSNRLLLDWFVDNCGATSDEKRLPEFVFELDANHLRVLLKTLIKGDGTPSERTGNVDKFWTKSDALKDEIVRLGVRCGHKPTVKKERGGVWYVSFGKRGSFNKSVNASVEEHDGDVYCLTAESNHVVLAGRGGKFQWIGQSLYPMSMISVNASPETKVGDDYEGETFDVEMPDGSEVRFRKEPEGLTKSIVTELLEERDKKKEARDEHEMGSEEYTKYDNQQNAIKVVMNCFDGETEVVGEKGVKRIDEVDVGEKLYTIDPETREVEAKRVVETQEYLYDEEMVDIETRYIDFSVTPNHRMLVDAGSDGEAEFVEAGDLNDYTNYQIPRGEPVEGRKPETFSLIEQGEAETAYLYTDGHGATYKKSVGDASDALEYESNRKAYKCDPAHVAENPEIAAEADEVLVQRGAKHSSVPAEYKIEDWLRFVGWYVSKGTLDGSSTELTNVAEGSVYEVEPKEYENATRGRSKKVQVGQLDDEGRDRIVSLLERMGLNPSEEARQISVCNAVIADWLTENCGSGSANKHLPEFVFELDASLLEHLFDALIRGDGDTYSGIRYSTKSDQLKDDVVRLAVHLGYKPLVNSDSGVWRVRFSDNKGAFRTHRNGSKSESDGKVYCVTMEDNHTVLAGRNGKFQWVGQSYYGVAGYPRFRLYDREMGSAVTATGRKVIEHTKEVVEDEGYEVVYGDTDSTLVELGDGSLETLVERGESIEETVNESYDDFAVEEFNAREHRWEIEFEKLYRRFFQAGRKKRYAGRLVWKEGKEVDDLDITGFEYKRSDVAQVTKEVQKEVIRRVLDGEGFDEISAYLQKVIERFKDGEYGYDEVGIPGGIGQKLDSYDTDTAQVKGARYANENLGTNFTSGSKPKRLYVKRVKGEYPTTDVVCFEYPEQIPEEFEIDWDKMLEKTVQGPIERILEALDWSWSEVVTGQRQQGLGSFT